MKWCIHGNTDKMAMIACKIAHSFLFVNMAVAPLPAACDAGGWRHGGVVAITVYSGDTNPRGAATSTHRAFSSSDSVDGSFNALMGHTYSFPELSFTQTRRSFFSFSMISSVFLRGSAWRKIRPAELMSIWGGLVFPHLQDDRRLKAGL